MTQPHIQIVIDMARAGKRPANIAEQLGISKDAVGGILHRARRRGMVFPHFSTGRRPEAECGAATEKQPESAGDLTPEELGRIAELAARGLGPTRIAPLMRKPYRVLFDAIDQLGLSRVAR